MAAIARWSRRTPIGAATLAFSFVIAPGCARTHAEINEPSEDYDVDPNADAPRRGGGCAVPDESPELSMCEPGFRSSNALFHFMGCVGPLVHGRSEARTMETMT